MAITSKDYFKKEPLYIEQSSPNNGIPADSYAAAVAALNSSIETYERRYLKQLLGKSLYEEFISSSEDAKWAVLKSLLWESVDVTEGETTTKVYTESPVADFIYFWHVNDYTLKYNGETYRQSKSDNSVSVSVIQKQVFIWQEMKRKTKVIKEWLVANASNFPALNTSEWQQLEINYNSFSI